MPPGGGVSRNTVCSDDRLVRGVYRGATKIEKASFRALTFFKLRDLVLGERSRYFETN